jgi:hypothetical protein
MSDVRTIFTGRYEASLAMLDERIRRCPEQHWDGKTQRASWDEDRVALGG